MVGDTGDALTTDTATSDTIPSNTTGESTMPTSSDECLSGTLCAGSETSTEADCAGGSTDTARNDNATYASTSHPLLYSAVKAYDSCATGTWWESYRGWYAVQYVPGGYVSSGMYTIDDGATGHPNYYVLASTPAGGVDVRWSGQQSDASSACSLALGASTMAGLTLGPSFPCVVPPPPVDETVWMFLLS